MKRRLLLPRMAIALAVVAAHVATAEEPVRRDVVGPLLDAFREVIREPGRSTVEVYCNGSHACFGAIIRSDGHIITKASELKGRIQVRLDGSKENMKPDAKIVAVDPATDLAILKIDATGLPAVRWSTDAGPAVGSWLASLGLIHGQAKEPVSIGVVSVAARKISSDAALGVVLDDVAGMARLASVRSGLPGDKAGLRDGDIVRKLDGEPISSRLELQQAIRSHLPGDKISLTIEREGAVRTIEATLGSLSEIFDDRRAEFQNKLGGELSNRRTLFPLAIQHDSVLRPSECGGPVVDIDGKVVGLNIARAGRVESYALPAAVVRDAIDRMLKTELVSSPAEEKPIPRKSPTAQER
jgi:serine protease Do